MTPNDYPKVWPKHHAKSLTIPQTIAYVLPESRTAANMTVAAQLKDDRGNLINQALQVQLK